MKIFPFRNGELYKDIEGADSDAAESVLVVDVSDGLGEYQGGRGREGRVDRVSGPTPLPVARSRT